MTFVWAIGIFAGLLVGLTVALPAEEEAAQRRARQARPQVIPLDGGGNRYGGPEPSSPAAPAPDAH